MNRFLLLFTVLAFISNIAIAQSITQQDVIPEEEYISLDAFQAGVIVVENTSEITDDDFNGTLDLSFIDTTGNSFAFHHEGLITKNGDQIFWSRAQEIFLNEYYFTYGETELILDSVMSDNEFLQEPVWEFFDPGQVIIEYPLEAGSVLENEVYPDGVYDYTDTLIYLGVLDEYISPFGTKEGLSVFRQASSDQPSALVSSYLLYDLSLPTGMIYNVAQIDIYEADGMYNFLFQEWDFRNINLETNIDEMIIASEIELYPNPTSDFLNIRSNGNQHIEIYDSRGRNVDRIYCDSFIQTYDVGSLEPGLYLLRGEQGTTQRFIITPGQ